MPVPHSSAGERFPYERNLVEKESPRRLGGEPRAKEACVPQKQKKRRKNTPVRRVRSSGPSAEAAVKDLVSIYEAKFSEIGSKVVWREEQTKELPTSESGPLLNHCTIAALEEARPLFREFVREMYVIGLSKRAVHREAENAWPLFEERCARFATPYTLKPLERNALAAGAGGSTKGHVKPAVDSLDMRAGGSTPAKPDVAAGFLHAQDFSWVGFDGQRIPLTQRQAEVVRILAEAGPPYEMFHKTILTQLKTEGSALRDTFRHTKLWGTLIVSDRKRRTIRLSLSPATK